MSCLPNLKEATMNVFELPFNRFIGLEPSTDSEYLLMVSDRQEYLNHLNTVHASTQFALAEATSGFFLQNEFQGLTGILPVVRRVETKYKRPAQGCIYSKAEFLNTNQQAILNELNAKQRVLVTVRVMLYDAEHNNVMQSDFEWYIARKA